MTLCRSFDLACEQYFRTTGRALIATGRILSGCLSLSIPDVSRLWVTPVAVSLRWLVIVRVLP